MNIKETHHKLENLSPSTRTLLQNYTTAELALNKYIQGKNIFAIGYEWKDIVKFIASIENAAYQLLDNSLVYAVNNQIDQKIWQSGVYQFIQLGRRMARKKPAEEHIIAQIMEKILKRGIQYFQLLLTSFEKKYKLRWNPNNGTAVFKDKRNDSTTAAFALASYTRILVYVGDAHRCNLADSSRLQHAIELYERARRIDPTKGRCFFQMGVVSKERRDLVTSVYNFTRALSAPSPILDAHECLLELYDSTYKAHKRVKGTFWYEKANKLEIRGKEGVRKQLWVHSIGFASEPQLPDDPHTKEVHFQSMSPDECYNRFALTFTHYIGKLYTHIGLDTLDQVAEEALVYFEHLFFDDKTAIHSLRLVQILTLIIYIIDRFNPLSQKKNQENTNQRVDFKLLSAIQFGMEIFGVMAERLARLVEVCDWDHKLMEPCCTGLHIWCNWMEMNPRLWSKPRLRPSFCLKRLKLTRWQNKREPEDDNWIAFARLMTSLEPVRLKFSGILCSSISQTEDEYHLTPLCPLPECMNLVGLEVLSESEIFKHIYFSNSSHPMVRDQNFVRMTNIHQFGSKFLFKENRCKFLSRSLKQDNTYSYKSLVNVRPTEKIAELCGLTEDHYHFWTMNYTFVPPLVQHVDIIRKPDCNNSRVIIRSKKKKANCSVLPKRPRMPNYELWLFCSDKRLLTEILVQPLRIVLDTNCYVRSLSFVRLLVSLLVEPIFLPVVVLLELRGLAKGGLTKKDTAKYGSKYNPDAQDKLSQNEETAEKCRNALEFIASNMQYFQVIDTTAVVLNVKSPYDYVSDPVYQVKTDMSSDDRILEACKYLECNDIAARKKDCPRRIYRKTLLVTGDRFLRIKSNVLDIPTRDLGSTLYWYYCNRHPEEHERIMENERTKREQRGYYNYLKRRKGRGSSHASRKNHL